MNSAKSLSKLIYLSLYIIDVNNNKFPYNNLSSFSKNLSSIISLYLIHSTIDDAN